MLTHQSTCTNLCVHTSFNIHRHFFCTHTHTHSQLSRLNNDVLVNRKLLPEKEKLEQELINAQIELKECEREMREVERAVENANDPFRLRLLPGGDPSRNELANKIETLEVYMHIFLSYSMRLPACS